MNHYDMGTTEQGTVNIKMNEYNIGFQGFSLLQGMNLQTNNYNTARSGL